MKKYICISLFLIGSVLASAQGITIGTGGGLTVGGTSSSIFDSNKDAGTITSYPIKNQSVSSGATYTWVSTITNSGYISEVNLFTNKYATEVIITVDGEATPSIDCNLADLLGDAYMDTQPAFFNNWVSGDNAGTGNLGGTLKLPIPFASSVKVEIKNNDASPSLLTGYVVVHTGVPDKWNYTQKLHVVVANVSGIAANAETNLINVSPGKRWRLAGFGWIYDGFPGTVTPRTAPLEGAFKIYQDGSAAYVTGGSEDIFGLGWYFNHANSFGSASSNIIAPMGGDQSCTIGCQNNTINTWGAQRFFIKDPITGSSSLRMSWICGNTTAASFTGTCSMLTTVYYYTEN